MTVLAQVPDSGTESADNQPNQRTGVSPSDDTDGASFVMVRNKRRLTNSNIEQQHLRKAVILPVLCL